VRFIATKTAALLAFPTSFCKVEFVEILLGYGDCCNRGHIIHLEGQAEATVAVSLLEEALMRCHMFAYLKLLLGVRGVKMEEMVRS
jgi:hypothetical protein